MTLNALFDSGAGWLGKHLHILQVGLVGRRFRLRRPATATAPSSVPLTPFPIATFPSIGRLCAPRNPCLRSSSQIPYSFDNTLVAQEVFPEGKLDADLQQIDLRKVNSWRLKLGQIETWNTDVLT